MQFFTQSLPPLRLVSGQGALERLGEECDRLGVSQVALLCSGSLLRNDRLHRVVRQAIGKRLAGTFAGVAPHSPLPVVEAAVAAVRGMRADAMLAIGGGSVIVTARAAAILLAEGRPTVDLCTRMTPDGGLVSPRLMAPKLPQIVVPTTPTTAAVKAGAALHDPSTGARLALFDPGSRATTVVLAPEVMGAVPPHVVRAAAFNTLAMAVEGLMSPQPPSPLADAALIHAIRLSISHLALAVLAADAESRLQLAMAAVLAGQGTDYAGGGVVSALGHAIGPRHGVENGIVNAILLPAAMRFNAAYAAAGLEKIATGFGLPARAEPEPIIAAIDALAAGLAVPRRLGDLGVVAADLPPIAMAAMQDWFVRGNPRPILAASDLVALMADAL